ncbi:MAG TPA: non-canonical purine NTP pyrophosphatase, partial [Planctomycetota bacterium]|nr:non-canonical purine NTP pyrophosphatase [Planctomycetota bacterium]
EEIRLLLEGLPIRLLTLDEAGVRGELVEDGETFSENAAAKAEQAARACGLAALADDSGLEVDALGGRPGVRSARYSGPGATDALNNAKLVAEARAAGLDGTPARFRCAAALRMPESDAPHAAPLDAGALAGPGEGGPGAAEVSLDGLTLVVEGSVEGTLLLDGRGSGGFGYDPHFLLPALGRTMAELPRAEKNRISHRARAFGRMRVLLEALLRGAAAR